MSINQLDILDLIVVSHYLDTSDIIKFKYINHKFKDIQERILINYNPIIVNDNLEYYQNQKVELLSKFPNIQTICVDYYIEIVYFVENVIKKILTQIKQNSRLKLIIHDHDDVEIIEILNHFKEFCVNNHVYLCICLFNNSKQINMIYKTDFYLLIVNATEYSYNILNRKLFTIESSVKTVIINNHFKNINDVVICSEHKINIIIKNVNKIFDCKLSIPKNSNVYLENINAIYYNSITLSNDFNLKMYQVKYIQNYAIGNENDKNYNMILYGIEIKPQQPQIIQTTEQKFQLHYDILTKYSKSYVNIDVDNVDNVIDIAKLIVNHVRDYRIYYQHNKRIKTVRYYNYIFNNYRIFIDFELIDVNVNTIKIKLNRIIMYLINYLDKLINAPLNKVINIDIDKVKYHNNMYSNWLKFKDEKIDLNDEKYSFILGFEEFKASLINELKIGEHYFMLYI